jgi:two-component system, chemotaxis family, CheB/CheR fusion protein
MSSDNAAPEVSPVANDGLPPLSPDFVEQEWPEEIDNIIPTRGYHMTRMVGLGGSAGSITALLEFFRLMPPDSGMVFVVVLHLSASHESTLAELLSSATSMPVVQATDGQKVLANHVYVIPPGKYIAAVNGHLKLTHLEHDRGRRVAVDLFFRTLSDTHG